jgi:hypothetical protein
MISWSIHGTRRNETVFLGNSEFGGTEAEVWLIASRSWPRL